MGAVRKASVWLGLAEEPDYEDEYADDSYFGEPEEEDVEAPAYQIATVHPTTFHDARTVAEYFREDVPVIMNLSGMEEADARRVVDFASGLVFGLRGSIERIANRVFLLVPANTVVNKGGGVDRRFVPRPVD